MLTIFAVPKPFRGHIGMIQRNAITSWSHLSPGPEIILFGDEEGTAQIAQELGLRHVPKVLRNKQGTPLLNDIFGQAQSGARHDILCYVNADIVLLGDFTKAVQQVAGRWGQFLMAGQRTDLDVGTPINFSLSDWDARMRALAFENGVLREQHAIDYFVFRKGLFNVPPFALGRFYWDNWLLWRARSLKAPVVDASTVVLAVHQNHDFGHHPGGQVGIRRGEEALANHKLAGAGWACSLACATHSITRKGIRRNFGHYFVPAKERFLNSLWLPLLVLTSPIRHPLGLRRRSIAALMARVGLTRTEHL